MDSMGKLKDNFMYKRYKNYFIMNEKHISIYLQMIMTWKN